jgi:uncharacterized RDD family membrane protein YckC
MLAKDPPLDTTIQIVTPENIAFSYQVAGPFKRLLAYAVDLVCLFTALQALMALIVFVTFRLEITGAGIGIYWIIHFVAYWFAFGIMEAVMNGQTLGKRAFRLRVVCSDGRPISGAQAILRNLLRPVDAFPLFYQVGLLVASTNQRFQRIGDLACGTMVIVEEPSWFRGVKKFHEPFIQKLAEKIPPDFRASPSLLKAIGMYVERRSRFAMERRQEIARHIAVPLLERCRFPVDTNPDLFLCAIYHQAAQSRQASMQMLQPETQTGDPSS